MAKAKIDVMVCDNPNCNSIPMETSRQDPALGYYLGKGMWHDGGGGGGIPATYACSTDCIGPAVMAMIDKANR